MKKLFLFLILLISMSCLFADELQNVIPPEDGMIEYFFFIDGGWGIDDPYSYTWSKEVDEKGREYIKAVSDLEWYGTIYHFYKLSENEVNNEYDSWTMKALSLNRDSDSETNGSIKEKYIFVNLPNEDRKTFKYDDYIGYKIHFMDMQHIPYRKFNLVIEFGSSVMDF